MREFGHHRHQITGTLELAHHRKPFWVDAAPHPMHQGITLSVAGVLEISHGADGFASRQKDQLDRIIETPACNPFESSAVGPHTPDARSLAVEFTSIPGLNVIAVPAVREIEPAVRSKNGPCKLAALAASASR